MIKIGINGFGRIGRMAFRAALQRSDVKVVAVNDLLELPHLAYLLKHDSVHGRLRESLAIEDGYLVVDGQPIRATSIKDPAASRWGDAEVDVVIESTGIFLTRDKTEAHLRAGAKRVIISAPKGRLTGMSFRVPTSDVSVVDLTCELAREASYEEICAAMKRASQGPLKGVLGYTDEEVVSTDMRGESCTSVFDAKAGIQLDPTFVKLIAWYDNEWAYSSKLLDLALTIAPG
jgi:glyceraldehyde-3-phosphate dehydrogenase/erythrose-4-phosphate dehydrogenase